ncbi:hypothetical protein CHS0354_012363 [Potamilus streckersoni]|uniref:CN hydrolase domain-containing protein n=1 Tax=Potamilus streckersoni TaxID=2493646 RepID=A0AAE0SK79_9BIVA|nr:hypothetical protein CHS0354_012363 [Potamilus streckersoni]
MKTESNIGLCILQIHFAVTLSKTFRGAVYEHAVILPDERVTKVSRDVALRTMMNNLMVYQIQANIARQKNVDLLVFPEDGIYGMQFTRAAIEPYLEYIPNPETDPWNPCENPVKHHSTEVQFFLSCLAKNNSLYLVANIGDKQLCNKSHDPQCPVDGHYQYNTNVVYDKTGKLVARYHKKNLFYEFQFDNPVNEPPVSFDTPFGKFGTFTCFDILFYDPPMRLIEEKGIRNIVFPTAWMDALPLLAAVQFHAAFAAGMKINFLTANIHRPRAKFQGSGIYTPLGALDFYYNDLTDDGKLLIKDIDILQEGHVRNISFRENVQHFDWMTHASSDYRKGYQFKALVFGDLFNLESLSNDSGIITVCHNRLCCQLEYVSNGTMNSDLFAFGAFDGLHTLEGRYYIQVCAFFKCKHNTHHSCGSPTKTSRTVFQHIHISGNFERNYIFPEILLTSQGKLELPPIGKWSYNESGLYTTGLDSPLLSASLFSRVYERDNSSVCCLSKMALLVSIICLLILYLD